MSCSYSIKNTGLAGLLILQTRFYVVPTLYFNLWCGAVHMIQCGLPLIRPPLGPVKVEGWPHFRGRFALGSILWDTLKWPEYRGDLISGVQIRGSSLYDVWYFQ